MIDQEDEPPGPIEIVFRVSPFAERVAGISLNIANAPKCEVFVEQFLEYHSVAEGLKQEDMPELDVYKYDINFSQRPTAVVSLKVGQIFPGCPLPIPILSSLQFKSTSSEVLIFGIDVFVCPVPSGESRTGIDLQNVEQMLAQSSLGISEAAERCKSFLKVNLEGSRSSVLEDVTSDHGISPAVLQLVDRKLSDMETRLKSHLEDRLKTLELNQERHFRLLMERLDSVLNLPAGRGGATAAPPDQ